MQLLMQFVPKYLRVLCQSPSSPAAGATTTTTGGVGIVSSGGINAGGAGAAGALPPPLFRFARNLAVTVRAVFTALDSFTRMRFAGSSAAGVRGSGDDDVIGGGDGGGGDSSSTTSATVVELVLAPLGAVVLSPRALRVLLSDPRHRFVVERCVRHTARARASY
jgi:hypothetical protein